MGAIKRNIPNFLTCLNLLGGCMGIILLFNGMPIEAAYAMFIAAVFDFFDGLLARALKVTSPIGKDLDSLADMITFGLLPGLMAMNMVVATQNIDYRWSFICLVIPIFSALRLAIFNNDTRQSFSFKGLATPANGLFWACLSIGYFSTIQAVTSIGFIQFKSVFLSKSISEDAGFLPLTLDRNPLIIIGLAIILSFLLVSRIDLIAFKLHNFSFKKYSWHFVLLILSVVAAVFLGFAAAPIILLLYIIISQIYFRTTHEIQS